MTMGTEALLDHEPALCHILRSQHTGVVHYFRHCRIYKERRDWCALTQRFALPGLLFGFRATTSSTLTLIVANDYSMVV
jgi:hypothetical protein